MGGREGPGQRINGDYELLEGPGMNGRPCWLRRGRLEHLAGEASHPSALEGGGWAGEAASEIADVNEERHLYLFFSDMGYWTIAPSLHATGVQVHARSGPAFQAASPDVASSPWVIFARGRARSDPSVLCFRHDAAHQPPEIVHLSGCKGNHSILNGYYHLTPGVTIGLRPVFIKDGLRCKETGRSKEEEKKIIHFSQRSGRWLVSSAVADVPLGNDAVHRQPNNSAVTWRNAAILALSPVAWTSLSPVHLMPREPWSVRSELPKQHPARNAFTKDVQRRTSEGTSSTYEPCMELRLAHWTAGAGPPATASARRSPPASPSRVSYRDGLGVEHHEDEVASPTGSVKLAIDGLCIVSIHLQSPQGLSDPYAINGDYVKFSDTYADRPVYVKLPVTSQPSDSARGEMVLYFDDRSGRWHVAPQLGSVATAVARSPVDWSNRMPPLGALWQLRASSGATSGDNMGGKGSGGAAAIEFRDWPDLVVKAIVSVSWARTVMFAGETAAQSIADHALAGDFRLVKKSYGRRPVYRRAAQVPAGSLVLYLFFEPRSGSWVVSHGSPFAAHADHETIDNPGLFGDLYARSGPSWTPFTPELTDRWDVFDRKALSPEDMLAYRGCAPNHLMSSLLTSTPWLRLHALYAEAPPTWLGVGGFTGRTQVLNGTYELVDEAQWSSRAAWKRLETNAEKERETKFAKYLFFWPETGHWIIGPELHVPQSALARHGSSRWSAEIPDQCVGRWGSLNGTVFHDDPFGFVRRKRTAGAGVASPPMSPRSPRQSRGGADCWSWAPSAVNGTCTSFTSSPRNSLTIRSVGGLQPASPRGLAAAAPVAVAPPAPAPAAAAATAAAAAVLSAQARLSDGVASASVQGFRRSASPRQRGPAVAAKGDGGKRTLTRTTSPQRASSPVTSWRAPMAFAASRSPSPAPRE